ncbi:SusC/RagA family TonB-linked outer membrane protein [Flavobacterium sp. N3904]|uniref:SusC/RagA family TonB-linked outer membrane protein n=1 Tax=Flavobacterium sp. N3904 TaxID=2986835 RepID=UPI002224138A|nr:SusC/RagA family TonB-linked outer membrane protein [Flavobacterium sp. N3904]
MKLKFNGFLVLLVVLVAQLTFAQERSVSGIVSDNAGLPLPGVSVLVKGTKIGTQSDFDGKFTIKAAPTQVLVFSYVGMKTTEKSASSTTVNAKLSSDATELESVVVTGAMGIKKKKEAQTSTSQVVKGAELNEASNPNIARSLVGKVSGVQVNNTSNGVEGSSKIIIRGFKSINTDGAALIVIDGVISTNEVLSNLPPSIVESSTILKGAQAAALYGSLGINGAVLITTKKGSKSEKFKVTLNSAVDFEKVAFVPEKQDKYGQGWNGAFDQYENGGWGEPLDGSMRPVGLPQEDGSQIMTPYSYKKDNIKAFYQDGLILQNGVTLEVGGENGYGLFQYNNENRNFIVEGDGLNRNNFLFKGGHKFGKFSIDGSFNYNVSSSSQSDISETLANLIQGASSIPMNEFKNAGPLSGWTVYYDNPFWKRDNNRLNRTKDYFNNTLKLAYTFTDNISAEYNGGIQFTNSNQTSTSTELSDASQPIIAANGADLSQISSFYQSNSTRREYGGNLLLHFNYKLTDDLGLKFDLGQNLQFYSTNIMSQGGVNLGIPGWYNIVNVINPAIPRNLRNNAFEASSIAHFANVDLDYKSYLFLNLTGRYESTSTLPKNNRNFFYPSAGLSFVPTKAFEGLSSDTMNFLKVYANFTQVGSTAAINPYDTQSLAAVAPGYPFPSTGNSYTDLTTQVDPNIKPEFYTTYEAGVNFAFFNDRLTFDAAAYKTTTSDLISTASTSFASGITNLKTNVGDVENKGFELDLGFTAFQSDDWNWTGRVGYTQYDTKLISLNTGADAIELYDVGADNNMVGSLSAVVGKPFPALMGPQWTRDDQGRVIISATTGLPTVTSTNQYLGKATPDYIINYTNTIAYKNLALTFTLDYRTGNKFFSETKYNLTWPGHLKESAEFDRDLGFLYPNSVINTGTAANPVYTENTTVLTGAGYGGSGVIAYYNSFASNGETMVVDGTALKVREISLTYTMPSKLISNIGMSSLRFSVNARNPFVLLASSNQGFADPEASNSYNANTQNGATRVTAVSNTSPNAIGYVQTGQYPSTKTFGFTINASF